MDSNKETFETWNKVAQLYQDKFMNMDLYNKTYDFICETLTKNKANILEIGCGPGNITKYLLSKRPDFAILGIDIAPNMIQLAKKNNPTAVFKVMDCRDINKLSVLFDGIICGFCLPYLSPVESQKFISDASDLLNENGLLYISFVEGDPDKSGFKTGNSGDRVYFYYYRLDDLISQLTENKFGNLQIVKVEFKRTELEKEIHTIITAKKILPVNI